MIKKVTKIFFIIITFLISSCVKDVADNPIGNQPPHTGVFLYPDSSISSQPSKINIHWWGDDPDGFVIGYYFTWNGKDWSFTNSNDSLFALQIGVADTNYTFKVSAVDNGGNGFMIMILYKMELIMALNHLLIKIQMEFGIREKVY